MEISALLIKNNESQIIELTEQVSSLAYKNELIKSVINKKNLSDYSLIINNDENNKLSLGDLFCFQININQIGSYIFFYLKEEFKKEDYIDSIVKLKDIKVEDTQKGIEKISSLLEILKESNPIFSIFIAEGNYSLSKEDFSNLPLINKNIYVDNLAPKKEPFLIFKKKEKIEKPKEVKEVEEKKEEVKVKKENKERVSFNWSALAYPFKLLAKEKFPCIFTLVSSFLISFTLFLGAYNAYGSKLIYIFFFVCTLIGTGLYGYIMYDLNKDKKLNITMIIIIILITLVGIGIALGSFVLYFNSAKDVPSGIPSLNKLILVGLLPSIGDVCLCWLVSTLLAKFIKKKD